MQIQIKNRFTGAVLFEGEFESMRACMEAAIKADADLADAYLARADLARANLAGAYLADANLADADLAGADLAGADLAGADLAGARNVGETNGSESIKSTTSNRAQRAKERALEYRQRNPDIPVIENLDARILEVLDAGKGTLDMGDWHRCETTHCRAGWAITLAGEAGAALEKKYGPLQAGRIIYRASTGRVPHFFADNDDAMEDLRACAATQQA